MLGFAQARCSERPQPPRRRSRHQPRRPLASTRSAPPAAILLPSLTPCSARCSARSRPAAAMTVPAKPVVHVDVFSDISCPWCWVGKRRMDAALEQLGGEAEFVVRYHAFVIDHKTAPQGALAVVVASTGGRVDGAPAGPVMQAGSALRAESGRGTHTLPPPLPAPRTAHCRRGVPCLQCAALGQRRLVRRPAAQRQARRRRVC